MDDAQPTQQAEDRPPFPTYAEFEEQDGRPPDISEAYQRLIWPITGDFPSAILVMKEPQKNTGDAEPFFNPETGEWHEIASHSITSEKVSAIEASVYNLEAWSTVWGDYHMEHANPENPQCEYVTYGDLSDDERPFAENPMREDWTWNGWEEDSDTEFLSRCCGQDRPIGKVGRTLEVRPSEGNDFVSIKDYVGGEFIALSPCGCLWSDSKKTRSGAPMAYEHARRYHRSLVDSTSGVAAMGRVEVEH
jgi:hypothetical protein